MPRIKRWFPVSHEINRDPELWALEAKHGSKVLRVWLELLSIADRNDGEIPGSAEAVANGIAWQVRLKTGKCLTIIRAIMDAGWAHIGTISDEQRTDDCQRILVTNYAKYHRTREQNSSPPNQTKPEPNQTNPNKTIRLAPSKPAPLVLPEWLDPKAWSDFIEHRKSLKAKLTARAAELAIGDLDKLRLAGDDPAAVINQSIVNGWRGLFAVKQQPQRAAPQANGELSERTKRILMRGLS